MFSSRQPGQKCGTVILNPDKTSLLFYQIALLVVFSALPYLYTLGNGFVYDDKFTITNNYLIKSWHRVSTIFTSGYFTDSGELSYRPVVTLSYFFDYAVWRLNPLGYHLTNILLHCLNTVLLFFLLVCFVDITNNKGRQELNIGISHVPVQLPLKAKRTFIAFTACLLFCIHPILAEAVNAISYREDVLVATFYIAAFFSCLLVLKRGSNRWYAASLLCYFLSLFAKEMAITFPLLVGLFDFLFLDKRRFIFRLTRYYIGYIAISVFYVLVRFVFLHNPTESYIPYPHDSIWINFLTMSNVLSSYFRMLFFPTGLNADYVVTHVVSPLKISFVISFLVIVSVGVITYRLYSHSRVLFFSVLWFFITLLPVMNIIPIENIMAERYLYMPLIGFCLAGSYMLGCFRRQNPEYKVLHSSGFVFISIVIVTGFSWQICGRSKVWHSEFSLWSETVKSSPQSSRVHNNLGVLYKSMGFIDAAIQEYRTAIQIRPEYSEAHGNLANVYLGKGISVLDKNVLSKSHDNLAKAYVDEGYFKDAIAEYKKSIEICPLNETAHFNLGVTYGKLGMFNDAKTEYENVLRINNNNPHVHNNLGNIYEDGGLLDKALGEYKFSVSIDPSSAITHNNIGNIYFKKGLLDEAVLEYRIAVKNNPAGLEYHENLANAFVSKGLIEEAIAEYEQIVVLHPEHFKSYVSLIMLFWNHKHDREKAALYLRKLLGQNPDQREAINKMIEKIGVKE